MLHPYHSTFQKIPKELSFHTKQQFVDHGIFNMMRVILGETIKEETGIELFTGDFVSDKMFKEYLNKKDVKKIEINTDMKIYSKKSESKSI